MKKFPYINKNDRGGRGRSDHDNLAMLQQRILESDDQVLKVLIGRYGIRRSGADAAALFLKMLPLERSNLLLKDLPRKRLKEAIGRIKTNGQIDPAVVLSMLGDLKPGAATPTTREEKFEIEARLTTRVAIARKDDTDTASVPFVIRALDLAGRVFGTRD